jgi:AcrR family transcriptional regulator
VKNSATKKNNGVHDNGSQSNGRLPENAPDKAAQTRGRLMAAARHHFAEKGYDVTNISDIVAEVDVAQGTFYYHFEDKKTILLEILQEFFEKLKTLVGTWSVSTEVGPEAASRFARSIAGLLQENRDAAAIVRNESRNTDAEIRNAVGEFYRYLYERTEMGLMLGIQLGVVRPLDVRIVAVALVGMMEKVVERILEQGGDVDEEHVIRELTVLQDFGIRPRG